MPGVGTLGAWKEQSGQRAPVPVKLEMRRNLLRKLAAGETLFPDNRGPLVAHNVLEGNAVNGMEVRAEELTIESVWDDTDIVHVVRGEMLITNFHSFGGLRLESSPDESLVVKLDGPNAGFTASGFGLDIDDRIGGLVQIIGQPLRPVVLTALADDSVGAGIRRDGLPQVDTNNDGSASEPEPGDWRSVLLETMTNEGGPSGAS